jgi:hypothetical protein
MRRPPLRWCFLGLAVFLVTTLSQGTWTTYAAAGSIVPSPSTTFNVPGMWHDSGAALTDWIPGSPIYDTIHITDQSYLRVGWVVKVDNEQMRIDQLIEGGYGHPDTMVVQRGWGTPAAEHTATTNIQAKTVTVDIMAQDVSDPNGYGLGAFKVYLTFPPDVQMIKMTYDWQWLSSTGRFPDCYPATETWPGSGTWQVSCATENNPGSGDPPWYPRGPSGSGRIARVTLLPPPSGMATVSLAGSDLLNVAGTDLLPTVTDLKVKIIDCPDVNLDGRINVADSLTVAKNSGDSGVDTGATILSATNKTQTQVNISDQSLLHVNDTIAIDNEQMSVQTLTEGSPDVMTVVRAYNTSQAATHQAGAHIFRATTDGNFDGKRGYTRTRDVTHDGLINVADLLTVYKVSGITCPSSP